MTFKMLMQILLWLLIGYVALFCFMYMFQRNFTFQPGGPNPFTRDHGAFTPLVYQTPMGLNIRGLYMPARQGKPTIVYFQGNAGNIGDRLYKTKSFLEKGYGFALVGYRGYSGNPGMPSEQNFYEDARSALKKLNEKGVRYEDMVLYGESIGTGVATQIATELPQAKALILEAPFTSTTDIAKRFYWFLPIDRMLKDKFENDRKIAGIKMPILIIHGDKDRTVPMRYGEKLFSYVTSEDKLFMKLPGAGHADVYSYKAAETIHAFLDNI
jgi:fermentation-respiration switch protein FrsA (DUF1100 family)